METFMLSLVAFVLSFIFITAFPPWLAAISVAIAWSVVLLSLVTS